MNTPLLTNYSEFTILATASNTTVNITPSPTADLTLSGTNITLTNLQPGETYAINSRDISDDVTGTTITANEPIAVFAGANQANVPDINTEAPNPLFQEQMPVEDWGTNVLSLAFDGRTNGDSYRVLAA